MFKKLALITTLAIAAAPQVSQAQVYDPDGVGGNPACVLTPTIFSGGITPTKCVGFFNANSMQFGTGATLLASGNTADAYLAMSLIGFNMSTSYTVLEKYGTWNNNQNFATTMSGWTVLGVHWGNYPGSEAQNVSAFYLFNVTTPTNDINLINTQGVSNAAILYTNGQCTDTSCGPKITSVPEPSTYALMTAGLLGIFGVARRRRNAKV